VEANPHLSIQQCRRLAQEIEDGKLVVEQCALVTEATTSVVPFYIH
jgi:hypothetical protein